MAKLFAKSGEPDQTPRSAASDLGLHCLPITLLRVSRLQWVKHHSETYIIKNPLMKQSKGPNGDLKPEHKKNTNRTTMSPTTDTVSQAPTF